MTGNAAFAVDAEGEIRYWFSPEAFALWVRTRISRDWRIYFAPIEDEI